MMVEFELGASSVRNDRSVNWATATAPAGNLFTSSHPTVFAKLLVQFAFVLTSKPCLLVSGIRLAV